MSASPEGWLAFGRLHPALVHLPIGFLVVLTIAEAASFFPRWRRANASAGFLLLLTVPAAIFAAVLGWILAVPGGYDERLLQWHRWTGVATASACVVVAFLYACSLRRCYLTALFATFGALVVASHFGGSLTHGSDYLSGVIPSPLERLINVGASKPHGNQAVGKAESGVPSAFVQVVQPIFQEHCTSCHGPEKSKAGLRLDTAGLVMKGGKHGAVVVVGDPRKSELVKRLLLPPENEDHMPPQGKPAAPPDDISLLEWWIEGGAPADKPIASLKASPKVARILAKKFGTKAPAEVATSTPPKPLPEVQPKLTALADELKVPLTALSETEPWLQCNASIAGASFGDQELAKLAALGANLLWLDLAGTKVTDAGLKILASMPNLKRLHLERTGVSDAGLAALKPLAHLEYLNVYATGITDAGLEVLKELPGLKQLYLWQSKVTPEAAKAFAESRVDKDQIKEWQDEIKQIQARIDGTRVVVDTGTILIAARSAATNAMNAKCPVSGKDIDPSKTVVYEGKTIAFCCDDCKAKFEKDPKAFLPKLNLADASKPVNTKCPVSGKDIDLTKTLVYEGKTIAFCCDDCKAKFEKDPKAFLSKLNLADASKPVNTKCPVSDKDVDASKTVVHEGKTIAFCCDDCKAKFQQDPKPFLSKLQLAENPK